MTRGDAVSSLVQFNAPLDALKIALAIFPFDWDSPPLAVLSREHLLQVLDRWDAGELLSEEVEGWADLVEVRDDRDHADRAVAEAIFDLANPELQGPLELIAPALRKRLAT